MFMYRIDIYRYRFRKPPATNTTANTNTGNNNTIPNSHTLYIPPNFPSPTYTHLESPQNIHDPDVNPTTQIVVRERGGAHDNHVQWVSAADLIPVRPFRSTSFAHGAVSNANWLNRRGDRVWLGSDQPLVAGKRSCPVVNLDLKKSAEVLIRDVCWVADKKGREDGSGGCGHGHGHSHGHGHGDGGGTASCGLEGERARGRGRERKACDRELNKEPGNAGEPARGPLTIAGPVYKYQGEEFRVCVARNAAAGAGAGVEDGILKMVTLQDMERFYEDVSVLR